MRRFLPISVEEYIDLCLENSDGFSGEELRHLLSDSLYAFRQGVRCKCGNPLWVIGSAITGEYGCYKCLIGQDSSEAVFEIDEACSTEESRLGEFDEILIEQVADVLKNSPDDYETELEKLGFNWFDDDIEAQEEEEEKNAVPENEDQMKIVNHLNGEGVLTDEILELYLQERTSEEMNAPLFRKYFKKCNENLKEMIFKGLDKYPRELALLQDLGYLCNFDNLFKEMIARYTKACTSSDSGDDFYSLAENFCFYASDFGYDAVYELLELFRDDPQKTAVIKEIEREYDEDPKGDDGSFESIQ